MIDAGIITAMPVAELLPQTITPYLTLMIVGFVFGILGHMYKSKLVVGLGILMIFAATVLLPLALVATEEEPASDPDILAPGTR
jgi:hypothetical protein